jgi:hypothetical protein
MNAPWTEHEDQMLVDEYRDGCVGIIRQIAFQLNRTRNAVIGRANRLGLTRSKQPWKPKSGPARVQPSKVRASMSKPDVADKGPAMDQLWTWAANRVHIIDLESHHCRWPVGDLHFCGGEKLNGSAYCQVHCRFAYTKPTIRSNTNAYLKVAYRY